MADAARIAQLEAQLAAAQAQAALLQAQVALAPAAPPPLTPYEAAMLAMTQRAQAGSPPTFTGHTGTGLEARKWLTGMQRWFDRAGVAADGERLLVIGTQLTGPAQVWWTGELTKALADPTRVSTWTQFEAACAARFQPVDASSVLRAQLATLTRKSGLSVSSYTERFLELVAGLPTMSEDDRVFQYKQGLAPAVHALLAPLVLPTLREVTEAALRTDALRTAAQGNTSGVASGTTSNSSSNHSGAGRFSRFAARLAQMESGEPGTDTQHALMADLADSFAEMEARLNATGTGSHHGRGGRSHRGGGRGGPSAPGGNGSTTRSQSLHPEPTPGLPGDMAQERMQLRLCIRCGRSGHIKRECTHDAFITAVKNPASSN